MNEEPSSGAGAETQAVSSPLDRSDQQREGQELTASGGASQDTGSGDGADVLERTAELDSTSEAEPGTESVEKETTAKLSVQELTAGWKEIEAQKPTLATTIRFGAKTNLGRVRENNEDKFDFFITEEPSILAARGCLYAVADGMGGHAAGQIASEYALNVIIRTFYSDTHSAIEDALRNAVEQANLLIHEAASALPARNQMGTTLTCAVIREDDLFVAQVGDSRAYLFREGELRQVTEDHSWVAEQVRRGAMTPEEAAVSPFRNYITRSLGALPEVEADLFHEKLQEGDTILLCSDGLCGMITDEAIAETLTNRCPSLATLMLVERANEAGGRDNVTAVVLQIGAIEPYEKKRGFRWPVTGRNLKR